MTAKLLDFSSLRCALLRPGGSTAASAHAGCTPGVDDGHGREEVSLIARAALHGAHIVGADQHDGHLGRRVRQLAVAQPPIQVIDLVVCRARYQQLDRAMRCVRKMQSDVGEERLEV